MTHLNVFNVSLLILGAQVVNMVIFFISLVVSSDPSANKKALKIIRLQERGINVITTTDRLGLYASLLQVIHICKM